MAPSSWILFYHSSDKKNELKGMFHDLLAFLKRYVLLSIASIIAFSVSSVHMPFLLVIHIQFNYTVDLLVSNLKVNGTFSLFVVCKYDMFFHHLWSIVMFMIAWFFLILASRNSMVCVLTQLTMYPSFYVYNPRI